VRVEVGKPKYNAIVLGVVRKEFESLDLAALQNESRVLYDVKGILKEIIMGSCNLYLNYQMIK